MTVLVALDHLALDEVVIVPRAATRIGEATMDLRAGERISVRGARRGRSVPSANDAADGAGAHGGGRIDERGSSPG